jgi:hypothetical protein
MPAAEEMFTQLYFAFWNIWSWWPWGNSSDNGTAKPYLLTKGKHTLYIGSMNKDLKIDKLLITNDAKYRPFGINQEYYTPSFEPATIIDYHSRTRAERGAGEAAGWWRRSQEQWKIEYDGLIRNHYLMARETTSTEANDSRVALIEKIDYTTYDASLRFTIVPTTHTTDMRVYLSYLSPENAEYLNLDKSQLTYVLLQNGTKKVERKTGIGPIKPGAWHSLELHRRRTSLSVELDSARVGTFELALPRAGKFGVGSARGGVGFDDVIVKPSDDPDAAFSFASMDTASRKDWDLVRNDRATTWTGAAPLGKGDLLVYRAPAWSNSQLEMEMAPSATANFSVFFPFQTKKKNVELRFLATSGTLNVVYARRLDGREETKELGRRPFNPKRDRVQIQSINGLYAIFLNDEKLYECNEYGLLDGTLALMQGVDGGSLPVQKLMVTRKDLIYDSFPANRNAELNPEWTVQDGHWKVNAAMEGAGTQGDGQLTARAPGTIYLGQEQWLSTTMQISADFSLESDFALLGWVDASGWLELHCRKEKVEIRKVRDGSPITLAECTVPSLKDGWHKIDFFLGKTTVTGKIDGQQVLSIPFQGMRGRSGIKNYGSYAAFDNLILQVLDTDKSYSGLIRPVDTSFVDIERALIK